MRPRRSALPCAWPTGAPCADIDREGFARWRAPRTAVYVGPHGLDRPRDAVHIYSKAQVSCALWPCAGAENAEPEPKPLGQPGLGYISAITVGLINPPT